MDNEKYGIELELIVNKFKEKMQQVKNAFKGIDNKQVNITANTAQINYLKSQINDLTDKIRRIDEGFETGDVLKYEAQLEKLTNQYNKLIAKQNEVSKTASKSNISITKGLDKMTSKIKRFGLSLLSIRSIWALVSRASSAYLAQDTELSNKLQSVWVGLGAMLAPIIERIADILAKAVKYINIFIKALTGVDLLARASAKSMAGTAKSAKALNKSLAGFDELTNIDTDVGGGTDGNAGLSGLEDVEIDTEWADRIRGFGEWVKENKDTILSAFLGIAGAIIAIKAGLGGLKALGIGLMIYGVVETIKTLIKYLNDPSFENFGDLLKNIGIALVGFGLLTGNWITVAVGGFMFLAGEVIKHWGEIKTSMQSVIDYIRQNWEPVGDFIADVMQGVLDFFDGAIKFIKDSFDGFIMFIQGVFTGDWDKAWKGIQKMFEAVWDFITGILSAFGDFVYKWVIKPVADVFSGLWEGIKRGFENAWNGIQTAFSNIGRFFSNLISGVLKSFGEFGTKVGETISTAFKNVINGVLSAIENILNSPIRAINGLISIINNLPGVNISRLGLIYLPRLATGTNYVPEDQVAMIHKGEAVIPKKFNSREYFGGGNEETNSKLDDILTAIGNIEINPYTTIRDVGKASLSYINAKSRQLGESVVK